MDAGSIFSTFYLETILLPIGFVKNDRYFDERIIDHQKY